jgi:hypothetical protein
MRLPAHTGIATTICWLPVSAPAEDNGCDHEPYEEQDLHGKFDRDDDGSWCHVLRCLLCEDDCTSSLNRKGCDVSRDEDLCNPSRTNK